jgi:DNA phosphorothioation-associated putative methyltransferase
MTSVAPPLGRTTSRAEHRGPDHCRVVHRTGARRSRCRRRRLQALPIGKLLPDDLYVHTSALDHLEPLLRIYEGCGRAYLGEVEGANVIKIHRRSGKLSYLSYPDFDSDPHPALARCVRLSLRTRELHCYDYAGSDNPPVLHRKETFLHAEHALFAKFARLTEQEEKHGLLNETASIGTRAGWARRLREAGVGLRGHRVVRCAAAEGREER